MFNPYHSYLESLMFYHLNCPQPFFNYQSIQNPTKISSNFVLVENTKNQHPRVFQDEKGQETKSNPELTSRSKECEK